MKRCLTFFVRMSLVLLTVFSVAKLHAAEPGAEMSIAAIVEQLLDNARSNNERDALMAAHADKTGAIMAALTSDLAVGTPDEYKRIPLIWRVAVAAGKRNNAAELKALLEVSLPKMDEPLRDWQAVVIGGGIINGISLTGPWPDEALATIIRDKNIKPRWKRAIDLAAAMTDDEKVKNGTRYDALRMLGLDTWEKRGEQLSRYMAKGVNGELQQGAIGGLADMKAKQVAGVLLGSFAHLSQGNRNFALDALLRDEGRIGALLEALEAGRLDSAVLGAERVKKLQAVTNKKLRARIALLFPQESDEALLKNMKLTSGDGIYTVGAAKIDITPDYPVRLHGYLSRKTESEGVLQRLFAKALAIGSDKEKPALLITVDNCMVPEYIRTELLRRLARKGITSAKLAVASSHTHSAPKLAKVADNIFGMDIPPDHQERIDRYTAELTDKLEQVALTALQDRKPGKLFWGQTKATFAANRRTKGGPVDHDLPVLRVTGLDGKIRALLVNYACHCTTLTGEPNQICADWAGYAQEFLEKNHPGAIALTAIGCGADANPSPRPGVELAQQHGQSIATAVDELLTRELTPLTGHLQGRTKRISLPLDKLPTKQELAELGQREDAIGYAARKNLKRLEAGQALQTEIPYLVQTWNFGRDLALVFLPGEVVVDYALRLKKEYDPSRMWVNGYANDVPCYIPSKRILDEGGYEGGGAMVYYDRPARLGPNTEELIIGAVRELMPPEFIFDEKKNESPDPLSVKDALKSFRTKPGFTVDCVASEPLMVDPVAIDFGTDGKLWVCEMHDYPSGLHGNQEPGGRIKLLTDTNGDGKFDQATTFLDALPYPTGVMQWRKGALICAAPDIIYAEDTNGDGVADIVKKLFTGFATHNFQARVNSLRWGLDNWVYGAAGLFGGKIRSELTGKEYDLGGRDFRMNPDTGEFEAANGVTQQTRVRDDWGNWFGNDNSTFLWNFPMPDYYVRRNPHVAPPEPRIYGAKDADPNVLHPVSRTLERFNNPNSANRTTSACGLEIYRDTLLGQEFYGNAFTGETVHNLVHRLVLWPEGISFAGRRPSDETQSEFFASTDNWFRPAEMRTGRDGALWISDMYRFVIEHPRWIAAERLAKLDVRAGADKGRIYRVYPAKAKLRPVRDLTRIPTTALVNLLNTPNGTERDLIHRELYQRQDKDAVKPLRTLAENADNPVVRAQALGVLDGLRELQPEDVLRALLDPVPAVRRNAIRLSEDFLSGGRQSKRRLAAELWSNIAMPMLRDRLVELVQDPEITVRFQLALSLGEWVDPRAGRALGDLAHKNINESWMRAAVLSSASHFPTEILHGVLAAPANTAGRTEMIGQLIATAAGASDTKNLDAILVAIAPAPNQTADAWQLVALASLQEALERNKTTLDKFIHFKTSAIVDAGKRVRDIIAGADDIARNPKTSVEEREAAIRLLAGSEKEEDLKTLVEFATSETNTRLQKAALAALRRRKNEKLPLLLVAEWKKSLVSVRPSLIEILMSREAGLKALLQAVEQGVIAGAEISATSRQQLLTHENKAIKEHAAQLFPPNAARQEVLAKFSAELPRLTAHPDRGAELFAQMCAPCHAFRGQGSAVGPDLMPLIDKSADDFLLAILDPNAVIEPRFVQYNIETKDDRALAGVISAETATSVTLSQAGGLKEKILRSDIADMKASSLSLMPEGLEQGKSAQEFADLIAYIKTRPAAFGSATAEQAAAALQRFRSGSSPVNVTVASERTDYASWMGTQSLAHCRQTDGNSKLVWESSGPPAQVNQEQFYNFHFPVGMGHYAQPAGKFHFQVNGQTVLDFDVSLDDRTWASKDGKVSLRYQIMETSPEDSNGVLTVSVKGDLLEGNKPATFGVIGTAAGSQRWFGLYVLKSP